MSDNLDRQMRDLWALLEEKGVLRDPILNEIDGITTWLFAWEVHYGQGTATALQPG